MRKFKDLTLQKKSKRVLFRIWDFLRLNVWGGGCSDRGLKGLWYWIRCHTYNRYHIINISGQDDYRWGWIDRDHAMYLACFALLVDFVENEDPEVGLRAIEYYAPKFTNNPTEFHDWYAYAGPSIESQLEREHEVRTLYDWWKTNRALEHKAHDEQPTGFGTGFRIHDECVWAKWRAEQERLEQKDLEMLDRLMKVRQSLWT